MGRVDGEGGHWTGSLLLVGYFTFGKNDSLGIPANLSSARVAVHKLFFEIRRSHMVREQARGPAHPGGDALTKAVRGRTLRRRNQH